jgi:hypothetical protein
MRYAIDQVALAEGGQHHHRSDPPLRDERGGRDAVHLRHLDVADDKVGLELLGQRDGLLAVGGLADDVETFFAQHLAQVETDESFVLGEQDTKTRRRWERIRSRSHDAPPPIDAPKRDLGAYRR